MLKTTILDPIATPKLPSRQQVADDFGVCVHTIARWEKQGLLKAVRINARVIRYRREDVLRLLNDATV